MLKYRLQGTNNSIKMGIRIILRSDKVEIINISDLLPEKGSTKYHRVYVDVEKVPRMLGIDTEEIRVTLATLLERLIKDEDIEPGDGKITDIEGIDIIPSNIELAALEASLVNVMNRERLLKDYVSMQRPFYDFIIIDCLPSLGMITINETNESSFEIHTEG